MRLAERQMTWPRHLLLYALCALPLLFFLEVAWLHPRPPLALVVDDNEQALFYNAKLLHDGRPVSHVAHPDMPLHYLGKLLIGLTGTGVEAAVPFIHANLFIAALLSALALALHARLNLRHGPTSLGAAGLALLMVGPSLWHYQHLLAAESLALAMGLPAVAIFANALARPPHLPGLAWRLGAVGFFLGMAIATKLSFLPLAAGLLPACCLLALGRAWRGEAHWSAILAAPLACLLTFLAFCWPVLGPTLEVARATGLENRVVLMFWYRSLLVFFDVFPVYAWAMAAAPLAALVLTGLALARRRDLPAGLGLELLAAWVFIVLGYLALGYTMGQSPTKHPEIAHPLLMFRNTAPNALVGSFALWLVGRLGGLLWPLPRPRWTAMAGALLVLVSLAGLTLDLGRYVAWRRGFLAEQAERAQTIQRGLDALVGADTPLVLWDESPSAYYGLASFHLWGNYAFADNLYDAELARAFPRLRWLHLRNLRHVAQDAPPAKVDYGVSLAPAYRYKDPGSPWDGEADPKPPLALVIADAEFRNEFRTQGEGPFLEFLKTRYPQLDPQRDVTHHGIGGIKWIVIQIR